MPVLSSVIEKLLRRNTEQKSLSSPDRNVPFWGLSFMYFSFLLSLLLGGDHGIGLGWSEALRGPQGPSV